MKEVILVKYGEIILKGLNRPVFERVLVRNIKNAIKNLGEIEITRAQATIYVDPADDVDKDKVVEAISKVFGVLNITRACVVDKDIEAIGKAAVEYCEEALREGKTFKVESKRADKKFPYNSIEISREVGGYIHDHIDGLEVDVRNPDNVVKVEIRETNAYVSCKKIPGQGGLPIGTGGKASLLLSGGIDSPVSGYMIAKRGVSLDAIHFFSYPYTSERAKQKVLELASQLSKYTGKINVHIVGFTEIQLAIRDKCPEEHMTLVMRRFMMKIAQRIALKNGSEALITGESIGQVASQTMGALNVTNSAVTMPVFRPLIGMDKEEIIKISRKIGTFETSILPYEDCCTVFTPKHPTTKPKLDRIVRSEQLLDVDTLIENALKDVEIIVVE